jgi:hypothetical protein
VGAKDRKALIKQGDEALGKIEDLSGQIDALIEELKTVAEEITADYEDQRANLEVSENLLARWEEEHGYKSDGWDSVASDLEEHLDIFARITETWEVGEQ